MVLLWKGIEQNPVVIPGASKTGQWQESDLTEPGKFAKNIIVLNKGEIVEFGKSKKIFKYPENNYTKMLLESRPPRKGRPNY